MNRGDMVRVKGLYIAEDSQRDIQKYLPLLGRVGMINQRERHWYGVTVDERDYIFYDTDTVEVLSALIPAVQQALSALEDERATDTAICLNPGIHRDHLVTLSTNVVCTNCLAKAIREAEKG